MRVLSLEQGSDEWRVARAGSLGASQVADALAKTKSGWGASRGNLLAQLVVERLTGIPTEGFQSQAMAWGIETEPQARLAYEFRTDAAVEQVGMVLHPTINGTHASPDGLVGADGLIEIKCPQSATHIETLRTGKIAEKYVTQMEWQMACTGRKWCDFVSFDPRMPENMALYIRRIERDDESAAYLEKHVTEFLAELDATVAELERLYGLPAAA